MASPQDSHTEHQPEKDRDESQQLSIPKEVEQNLQAPKIPGYVLVSPIGKGAFAQVWKAWQVRTHKWVAVKVFIQKTGVNWLFLQREVERLIKLDKHPHIVSLLDADLSSEPPWYAMDYLEGGSLERFVDPKNPARVDKAAKWMEEIAQALSYVHSKGLIHCDLKPANILLDEEGHVRVADFGQSRIVTESSGALGTLFYMAPEQAVVVKEGELLQPDVRWDIYGLGATMYAVLTSQAPHGSEENRKRIDSAQNLDERLKIYREIVSGEALPECRTAAAGRVDADFGAIVDKSGAASPGSRYGAMAEVLGDLQARREMRPVSPLATRRGYRLKRFLQRNAPLVALATLAFIGLSLAGANILHKSTELKRQLAYSYFLRGQYFAKESDYASAAVYYAQSNKLQETHLALANALALRRILTIPKYIQKFKMKYQVDLSPEGKALVTGGYDDIAHQLGFGYGSGSMWRKNHCLNIAYSSDGNTILTGSSDSTAQLWDAKTGKPVGKTMHHKGSVQTVAFSPDGKTVITGSFDGTARLWDAKTGEPIGKAMQNGGSVSAIIFSPDGKTVLTASSDTVRIWNTGTCKPMGQVMRFNSPFYLEGFNSAGKILVKGRSDNIAQLWDAKTGLPIKTLGICTDVMLSPNGKIVLTVKSDYSARLWDAKTGMPIGEIMRHDSLVSGVKFSPDGKIIMTGSLDHTVRLWNAETGKPLKMLRHDNTVEPISFSADGKTLLTKSGDNTVWLWDVRIDEPNEIMRDEKLNMSAVSPDGKTIMTLNHDGNLRFWDTKTSEPISKVMRHENVIDAVAFSPNGKTVLTGSRDKTARLWDAKTGESVGKIMHHDGSVRAVAFSPDGKTVLTGSEDKTARLWDARTGQPIGKVMLNQDEVRGVAISPDGRTILTVPWGNTVRIWDAARCEPINQLPNRMIRFDGWGNTAVFSPDGKTVLGSADKTARLWDARTGEPIGKAMLQEDWIEAVAFSPDGKTILTGSRDKTARLWDAMTGESIGKVMRHESLVEAVAFSPDGRTVLTGSWDKTARLWDAKTGEPINVIRHEYSVNAVSFSPDGKTILTGGGDHVARLWDVSWLVETIPVEQLLLEAELASWRKVNALGDIETITKEEWVALYKRYQKTTK